MSPGKAIRVNDQFWVCVQLCSYFCDILANMISMLLCLTVDTILVIVDFLVNLSIPKNPISITVVIENKLLSSRLNG